LRADTGHCTQVFSSGRTAPYGTGLQILDRDYATRSGSLEGLMIPGSGTIAVAGLWVLDVALKDTSQNAYTLPVARAET